MLGPHSLDWAQRRLGEHALTPYAVAGVLVLAVALFRATFSFVLAPGAYYFLYFPVVVLVAYWFGMRPALVATLLAGAIAFFVFGQPAWTFKTDLRAVVNFGIFVASAAAIAYVVTRMRARMDVLARDLDGVRAVTVGQADVFREYSERVSNHLQLISALLGLRARGEHEPDYSRVISNAASRTLLISRTHRAFANPGEHRLDFSMFAERLADAALESHEGPPVTVLVSGKLDLLPEQTTALALIVLECLNRRVQRGGPGTLRIEVSSRGEEGLLVIEADGPNRPDLTDNELQMFNALSEQLGGRLVIGASEERGALRLAFPTALQPLPRWDAPITLN